MAKTIVKKDENIEDALKRFKKDVARSGILAQAREKEYYVKPSVAKKIKARKNKERKY